MPAPGSAGAARGTPVASPAPSSAPTAAPAEVLAGLQQSIGAGVVGYENTVRLLAIALVSDGHVLLEGVPGLAKTFLVRQFSASLALSFKRIQFTPDMLPSDIVGTVVLNPSSQSFEYRRGPVFANVVLADEINRAPPKVQSALLEAMQEGQVTVDGVTHPLPKPFMVIATENPIEQEGTYPLPEAELDRLLFRIILDYPSEESESRILRTHAGTVEVSPPTPLIDSEAILRFRARATEIEVREDVVQYVARLVRSTRDDPRILVGASPRAGVQFLRAAKASALWSGRSYVTPEDAKGLAFEVLNHRLLLHHEVIAQQYAANRAGLAPVLREIIADRVNKVAAPR